MNPAETLLASWRFAAAYLLLLPPLAVFLWVKTPLAASTLAAVLRMSIQLLFVGLYLEVVFRINHAGLTLLWLLIMIIVADLSILRGCRLRLRVLALPLLAALLLGTLLPLLFVLGALLAQPNLLDARTAIPLGGMILGNCMRADLIGIQRFYEGLRDRERSFLIDLADGATLREASQPFLRKAFEAALSPTLATMATMGLVSLPGMMTGVILGGASPMTAILYQIMIMLAIYCGTSLTVLAAILFSMPRAFSRAGVLDRRIWTATR